MNTLKLLFSGMTAIIVTTFITVTTVDQPFEEKRADCIIEAVKDDIGDIETIISSSGTISFSGKELPKEAVNKMRLCGVYKQAHGRILDQLNPDKPPAWKWILIIAYAVVGLLIFNMSLISEAKVWIGTIMSKEKVPKWERTASKKKTKNGKEE